MNVETLEEVLEADSRSQAEELERQTEQADADFIAAEGVTFTEFLQQAS